jgi:hypothetical protein
VNDLLKQYWYLMIAMKHLQLMEQQQMYAEVVVEVVEVHCLRQLTELNELEDEKVAVEEELPVLQQVEMFEVKELLLLNFQFFVIVEVYLLVVVVELLKIFVFDLV